MSKKENPPPWAARERIGLFIDGASIWSASQALGITVDFGKLLTYFQGQGRVVRAFFYTALAKEHETVPLRPLLDWLDHHGYTTVTKRAREFVEERGRRKVKCNMNVEIAVDMIEMARHFDHIVLFSGAGDLRRAVEAVQRQGLYVTVVSTMRSSAPMASAELRRQADCFHELFDLNALIEAVGSSACHWPGGST